MSNMLTRRDRMIPFYFVAFFVVVAIVDAIMVTLAVRTHSGLVTEHAYEKGLAYNDVVAAANHQKALGWKISLRVDGGAKQGTAVLTLADAKAKPVRGANVTLAVTRPTQSGFDKEFTMSEAEAGTYRADLALPMEGLWQLRAYITYNGEKLQHAARVVVAP